MRVVTLFIWLGLLWKSWAIFKTLDWDDSATLISLQKELFERFESVFRQKHNDVVQVSFRDILWHKKAHNLWQVNVTLVGDSPHQKGIVNQTFKVQLRQLDDQTFELTQVESQHLRLILEPVTIVIQKTQPPSESDMP